MTTRKIQFDFNGWCRWWDFRWVAAVGFLTKNLSDVDGNSKSRHLGEDTACSPPPWQQILFQFFLFYKFFGSFGSISWLDTAGWNPGRLSKRRVCQNCPPGSGRTWVSCPADTGFVTWHWPLVCCHVSCLRKEKVSTKIRYIFQNF